MTVLLSEKHTLFHIREKEDKTYHSISWAEELLMHLQVHVKKLDFLMFFLAMVSYFNIRCDNGVPL